MKYKDMTVAELIEVLKRAPQNAIVLTWDGFNDRASREIHVTTSRDGEVYVLGVPNSLIIR